MQRLILVVVAHDSPAMLRPIRSCVLALSPKVGAGCGNSARPDLWRGCLARGIPTPTYSSDCHDAPETARRRALMHFPTVRRAPAYETSRLRPDVDSGVHTPQTVEHFWQPEKFRRSYTMKKATTQRTYFLVALLVLHKPLLCHDGRQEAHVVSHGLQRGGAGDGHPRDSREHCPGALLGPDPVSDRPVDQCPVLRQRRRRPPASAESVSPVRPVRSVARWATVTLRRSPTCRSTTRRPTSP